MYLCEFDRFTRDIRQSLLSAISESPRKDQNAPMEEDESLLKFAKFEEVYNPYITQLILHHLR